MHILGALDNGFWGASAARLAVEKLDLEILESKD